MLQELTAKNFAIIDNIRLEFSSGLSVLTGETGAGKSILIDAIELALGKRARSGLIRPGADKLYVSLTFDLNQIKKARMWLAENGLESDEENACIFHRTYTKDGRSQAYINGVPVTLNQLKEAGSSIIDIVGQNAHQQLLDKEHQLWLLDVRCAHTGQVENMNDAYQKWKAADKELTEYEQELENRKSKKDFLEQQLKELEDHGVQAGEFKEVEQKHRMLAHGEKFKQELAMMYHELDGEENSIVQSLAKVCNIAEKLSPSNKQLEEVQQLLNSASTQVVEAANTLHTYAEMLEDDQQSFEYLEQRLRQLSDLAKRYHIQPSALFDFLEQTKTQLDRLDNSESELKVLKARKDKLQEKYHHLATQISSKRHKVARQITQDVINALGQLNMGMAKFEVRFDSATGRPKYNGYERVEFMIQTNPGHAIQPLNAVSGGELSRISLALHTALSKYQTTPVLIFDEVDAGVSGSTAESVGRLLKSISRNAQVFCITHLSQVASHAKHHYQVSKEVAQNKTQVKVAMLNQIQRSHEVARLIAGEEVTPKSLKYAQEMIERAAAH